MQNSVFSERAVFEAHVFQVSYRISSVKDLLAYLAPHSAFITRVHAVRSAGFGMPVEGGDYSLADFAALCSEKVPVYDTLWFECADSRRFYINQRNSRISVDRIPEDFDIDAYFSGK